MSIGTSTPRRGRREFLSRVGGTAVAAAGLTGALPAPLTAQHDDDDFRNVRDINRVSQRERDAFEVRLKAALFQISGRSTARFAPRSSADRSTTSSRSGCRGQSTAKCSTRWRWRLTHEVWNGAAAAGVPQRA
jgi:hypothetical protein